MFKRMTKYGSSNGVGENSISFKSQLNYIFSETEESNWFFSVFRERKYDHANY